MQELDQRFWDERYLGRDQLWSGAPNPVLVKEVSGLAPGRVLDVGCGEGADAVWLAENGWRVTAVDISPVALERAAKAGPAAVSWLVADLAETPPSPASYDLVSAQYFPLLVQPGHAALRGLLDSVAPGGTMLFVGHDLADMASHQHAEHAEHAERGTDGRTSHPADSAADDFDPSVFYQPSQIAELLDESWTIEVNETRRRIAPPPPGTHHIHDTVLRARRGPARAEK